MTIEEITRTLQTVVESQANHESRLTKLEDSFKDSFQRIALAIEHLTQLATTTDGRLDDLEEKQIHTDARLDALIDLQMKSDERIKQIDERLNLIGEHLDGVTLRLDTLTVRVDDLAGAQTRTDEQIKANSEQIAALTAALARTDEQIKQLLAKNGDHQKS